ncbi:MAG: hypothetical protein LBR56_02545 [Sporomusaceae bacterium]|jgi:hypothetical protein|nr:hypothetical protein [Sporomusaceae bacterium]
MPFQDGDTEYLRQLAHIYPSEQIKEIKEMAAAVLKEQLLKGERQNIRELLYEIIEKINDTQNKPAVDENLIKEKNYQAAEIRDLAAKVDALLSAGQAESLAGFGPKAAAFLADALTGDSDTAAATAYRALLTLDDGGTIDALCQLWADTRREDLAKIIVKKGYLAAKPLSLRVLTVLKTGAASYMLALNEETLAAILQAADDPDPEIAAQALKMLAALPKAEQIDLFCQMVLAHPADKRLADLAVKSRYRPSDPARAALFYCLSGQWQKYFDLSEQTQRPLLSAGYTKAAPAEKEAFVAAAVAAGQSRLAVEILFNCATQAELENIADSVWEKIIDNIAQGADTAFLRNLIWQVPPQFSRRLISLLQQLNTAEWQEAQKLAALCPHENLFAPDGREVLTLADTQTKIECLAFHPSEPLLAAGCADGAIRFWRLGSLDPWRTVMAGEAPVGAIAFAADGKLLATASQDGKVNIWRLPGITWAGAVRGQTGQVLSLTLNNTGQIWAAAKNTAAAPVTRFWYWDGATMFNKAILPPSILALPTLHPATQVVFGVKGQIRAWQLSGRSNKPGGFLLAREPDFFALSVTPCGNLLGALDTCGLLNIWQIDTGALVASLPLPPLPPGNAFALSTQGDLAAIAHAATNAITIYRARFKKPLLSATQADLAHTAQMLTKPTDLSINTYQYLHSLLAAKLEKGRGLKP